MKSFTVWQQLVMFGCAYGIGYLSGRRDEILFQIKRRWSQMGKPDAQNR